MGYMTAYSNVRLAARYIWCPAEMLEPELYILNWLGVGGMRPSRIKSVVIGPTV